MRFAENARMPSLKAKKLIGSVPSCMKDIFGPKIGRSYTTIEGLSHEQEDSSSYTITYG
jgi:hypothetical protein